MTVRDTDGHVDTTYYDSATVAEDRRLVTRVSVSLAINADRSVMLATGESTDDDLATRGRSTGSGF